MPKKEGQLEEWKEIGEVEHYFPHPEVAVLKLTVGLKKGENIRIIGGTDTDFEQEVVSMEVDHKKVDKAGKGNEVGLKVKKKVREGYKVYKQ